MRGFAALCVVLNHTRGAFFVGGAKLIAGNPSFGNYVTTALLQATSLGAEFVILFFVLSGFAMAHSIRHATDIRRFYLKRMIRIWPPYIVAIVVALGVGRIIGEPDLENRLLSALFYIDPNTVVTPQFWSLPYEVLFYALCPLLLARRSRVFAGVSLALTAIAVLIWGPLLNPAPAFVLNFIGNALLFFAAGAAAYWFIERVPASSPKLLGLTALLLIGGVWASKIAMGGSNIASNILMIALTVLLVRNLPRLPFNLGYCRYSIYVFHYALISLIAWAVSPWIAPRQIENPFAWMLVVPFVLAGSWLLYFVPNDRATPSWSECGNRQGCWTAAARRPRWGRSNLLAPSVKQRDRWCRRLVAPQRRPYPPD